TAAERVILPRIRSELACRLKRTWSSLTLGSTPLNGRSFARHSRCGGAWMQIRSEPRRRTAASLGRQGMKWWRFLLLCSAISCAHTERQPAGPPKAREPASLPLPESATIFLGCGFLLAENHGATR